MVNSTVNGQANTFNLPNYHGELYEVSPTETPFLSAIGGINGARGTTSTLFEWQTMGRRTSSANNAALEGADAPEGSAQVRSNIKNVVEIHHGAIEISYSKLAAKGNYGGANIAPEQTDAYLDEMAIQTQAELESTAVDIEQSFLSGTFANPGDNTTPRKTQGVLGIAATVSANGGTKRPVTADIVNAHLQAMFTAGGKLPQDSTVLMAGPDQVVALSKAYASAPVGMVVNNRTIGGFNLETVITPFGTFGIMLNRWIPAGKVAVINLAVCKPTFLEVPNKGVLFVEPLGKTGSSDKYQLYGEVGLDYGPTTEHGRIDDLL